MMKRLHLLLIWFLSQIVMSDGGLCSSTYIDGNGNYEIPNTITEIGYQSFHQCDMLQSVTFEVFL
jgi:hypothetical protein